jgi:hypothetical protein
MQWIAVHWTAAHQLTRFHLCEFHAMVSVVISLSKTLVHDSDALSPIFRIRNLIPKIISHLVRKSQSNGYKSIRHIR